MEHLPVSRSIERYDLYLFESDLLVGWHKFDANNEGAAVNYAMALAGSARKELWVGDKLLRSWPRPK